MKRDLTMNPAPSRRVALAGLTMLAISLASVTGPAQAHEYYAEGFTFVHPWADARASTGNNYQLNLMPSGANSLVFLFSP